MNDLDPKTPICTPTPDARLPEQSPIPSPDRSIQESPPLFPLPKWSLVAIDSQHLEQPVMAAVETPSPAPMPYAQTATNLDSPTDTPMQAPALAVARKKRGRKPVQIPQEICQRVLELNEFYSVRQIAPRVGLRRELVRRVLEENGRVARPEQSESPTQDASVIEPFRDAIAQRAQKGLTITRIVREIREVGYAGGRTSVAQYVRKLKAEKSLVPSSSVKRRFETDPAEEMQIDWSPYTITIGGRDVRVHVLSCLLAWSRKLFVRAFPNERQSILFEGLACAFEYFDGVALRTVLDNMATAVVARIGPDRTVLWNEGFLQLMRYYGTVPFACNIRDPDRKGKDEKAFRLVDDDFIKGSSFDGWDDLHKRMRTWLDGTPGVANLRVHGTTGRVPNEAFLLEHPHLVRLPSERFAVHENVARVVDRDSTLWIHGTPYTVPAALANRSVAVRLFAEHFEVLDPHGRIAMSRRYVPEDQKGRLVIDPTHYANLPKRPRGSAHGDRLDEAFLRRFPQLQALVDGLKRRMKSLAPIHLRSLLRQCDHHGQDAFLQAALRAQEFRRFDALAIERILERAHPTTAAEFARTEPIAPLTGHGPAALGEVDGGSLDSFAALDDAAITKTTSTKTDPHGS